MKISPSASALFLAVMVHGVIALTFWMGVKESSDENIVSKREQRFGLLLEHESETLTETVQTSDLPSQPKSPIPPSPVTPTAVPQLPPIPIESDQMRRFTPDDREALPFSVLHHYGEAFFALSAGEQHYILDHLQRIRKINEIVGTRLLRERYHDDVDPLDNNVIEFTLNPDGSIENLALEKNRIGTPLDELTLQTIQLAHPQYPKPSQPTKIRIRVYVIVK